MDHEPVNNLPHPRYFPIAVAAAVLLVMIGLGSVEGVGYLNRRQILKEDTELFVESLIEEPLIGDINLENPALDNWFDSDFL